MMDPGNGGISLRLSGKHIVGFALLVLLIAPAIFWVGTFTGRVQSLESYIEDHEVSTRPLRDAFLRSQDLRDMIVKQQDAMLAKLEDHERRLIRLEKMP